MSVPSDKYADIERLRFTKADDQDPMHPASAGPKANGIPVLRVVFTYGGSTYTHDVPNGEFRLDNPALQFLAYIGRKPSDWPDNSQTLELDQHIVVPVLRDGEDSYALSNEALEMGAEALENADWFPSDLMPEGDENDESVRHSNVGGGGDDDGGSPTRGQVSAQPQTKLPEGVGIENNPDERGLTIDIE